MHDAMMEGDRPDLAMRILGRDIRPTEIRKPIRIQLSRRKGYRKPDGAVVVSRPSKWGNPFIAKPVPANGGRFAPGGRARENTRRQREAVNSYRAYLIEKGYEAEIREELRGKDLACWCPPGQPCHADVLLEIANG